MKKKKHLPFVIGASILGVVASAAGLVAKKNKADEQTFWKKKYVGHWTFENAIQNSVHQIYVDSEFKLTIDGQPVNGVIQELSKKQLVWQDKYGFQLVLVVDGQKPATMYDEADDKTYELTKLT